MSIYDQLVSVLGTPPNEMVQYLYFIIAAFLVITVVKMIYHLVFDVILNIKK